MKKFYKIFGIITGALLLCGICLMSVGFVSGADRHIKVFDFIEVNYGAEDAEVMTYTSTKTFESINVDLKMCDLEIVQGDVFEVEYMTYADKIKIDISDDTLYIRETGNGFNFSFDFSWLFGRTKTYVKVTLPEDEYNNITVSSNMGDVKITGIQLERLNADLDMGDASFEGTATEKIDIDNSMGDVTIEGYLECSVYVDCNMGDATVTTYYNEDSYRVYADTDMGNEYFHREGGLKSEDRYTMDIECDMGNIEINFVNP